MRYEPCDAGVSLTCLFPLEQRLGIVAGKVTAALTSRVGRWTAQSTQATVLHLLKDEQDVAWSATTLRNVAADLSTALAPLTHQDQVDSVLALLQQAHDSKGAHRPVLSVGRDGIFVPIRKDTKYREAATATLAVLDRAGRRLGTVYLGHMPEAGQVTLSQQLTALLSAVLQGWQGPLPRLQYSDTVVLVVFSPGGGQIASGCVDGTVQIRDARTGSLLHSLHNGGAFPSSLIHSSDGQHLAAADYKNHSQSWRERHQGTGSRVSEGLSYRRGGGLGHPGGSRLRTVRSTTTKSRR